MLIKLVPGVMIQQIDHVDHCGQGFPATDAGEKWGQYNEGRKNGGKHEVKEEDWVDRVLNLNPMVDNADSDGEDLGAQGYKTFDSHKLQMFLIS